VLNTSAFATLLRSCVYELNGDALMPRPLATYKRKVLYRRNYKTSRSTPKVSIPRWWVGDVEEVTLRVYEEKIVITKEVDDDD